MLGQFTWGQFLESYGAISLLWYLGLLFTAYRKEVMGLLGGRFGDHQNDGVLKLRSAKFPKNNFLPEKEPAFVSNKGCVKEEELKNDSGLMGKVNLPQGVEKLETSGLAFLPGQGMTCISASPINRNIIISISSRLRRTKGGA